MHCETAREEIQNWIDMNGASAMPAEIARHVRECGGCRAFITRWNTIELRLQSIRDESISLSPDFHQAVQARLREERTRASRPLPFDRWHIVVAGTSAAVLTAVLALRLIGGPSKIPAPHHAASVTAAARPAPSSKLNGYTVSSPITPALPLANTAR